MRLEAVDQIDIRILAARHQAHYEIMLDAILEGQIPRLRVLAERRHSVIELPPMTLKEASPAGTRSLLILARVGIRAQGDLRGRNLLGAFACRPEEIPDVTDEGPS